MREPSALPREGKMKKLLMATGLVALMGTSAMAQDVVAYITGAKTGAEFEGAA